MPCSKCITKISPTKTAICKECLSNFHPACTNLKTISNSKDFENSWSCKPCSDKFNEKLKLISVRKKFDNTSE